MGSQFHSFTVSLLFILFLRPSSPDKKQSKKQNSLNLKLIFFIIHWFLKDDETYGFAPVQTNSPALKTSPTLKVSPGPKITPSPTFPDFHSHLQPRSAGHFQSLPYLLNQVSSKNLLKLVMECF